MKSQPQLVPPALATALTALELAAKQMVDTAITLEHAIDSANAFTRELDCIQSREARDELLLTIGLGISNVFPGALE
jgi:hypothetical protein